QAPRYAAKPWVLYVGFFCPHPPFNAPPEFFERVRDLDVPWPVQHGGRCRPHHPAVEDLIRSFGFDGFDDATVRNAIRAYYALVAFVDDNVGQVLRALEETGLDRTTRTLYTTDHGESLGNRGLWGKFTLYEESAGVPLILRGPGVPAGQVCATPVTLADVFPTVLESLGVEPTPQDRALPGHSLLATARGALPRRPVVAEYHALGSRGANFMIRRGAYKYIHHVRYAPQLFDLAEDPEELHDLAAEPRFRDVREVCAADLRAVLDPAAVDARCKADQARMIARHGGREAILARGEGSGTQIPPELARTA
ncbi:MAG: sulfatase-like hydrolase/transferase, partial [Candidatus Lambdaproteobacteria bacterium]|nr:sulfatase-like hydrolase/transferase [Candidatus Lambdaproteobacteria bacterium]